MVLRLNRGIKRNLLLVFVLSVGVIGVFVYIRDENNFSKATVVEDEYLDSKTIPQDDPVLVQTIRNSWIHPPSELPYNLVNPDREDFSPRTKDATFLDEFLGGKEGGFFIECGAYNGEFFSPTLFLERTRKYKGLLIEANPKLFSTLLTKNRKAWSIQACLSTSPYPTKMSFYNAGDIGGLVDELDKKQLVDIEITRGLKRYHVNDIQCFPLYSILLALGNPIVDVFVLDIEGAELSVLKTIPFDKLDTKHIYVEYVNSKREDIKEILEQNGYDYVQAHDKNDLYKKQNII